MHGNMVKMTLRLLVSVVKNNTFESTYYAHCQDIAVRHCRIACPCSCSCSCCCCCFLFLHLHYRPEVVLIS